ncbi:MAG: DUF11 domain-containing protein [Acidobacteriota bacterium]|nr:DUF11 domain-containing protein [Acidobacteriota bacterium]
MAKLQRLCAVLSLFFAPVLFAQSANVSVTVSDSPDPVSRDGNITYTAQVTNSGPDAATNATFNVYNSSGLGFVSVATPAGWTCTPPAPGAFVQFSCTNPSLASGATSTFTVVATTDNDYYGNVEGTINTSFSAGSSTSDPNPGNNAEQESTAYIVPDADTAVTVTDSPDPVFPKGTITYTAQVSNSGPDPAINATFTVYNSSGLGFVSVTEPAGWSCTKPAVGAFVQFTCTNPSLAVGASSTFTVVATTDTVYYGNAEGTISTSFSVGSGQSDPNSANNMEIESTAYVTPDADVSVTVSDSPDPVGPDGNITYTVTVANAGPDAATNVTLNSFGSNNLRFVSASVPAGWNCTLPAPGTQTPGYSCTFASLASGANSVLTFVMQADDAIIGNADTTIQFGFSANSSVSDPVPGNNSETESTAYVTPDADVSVTVSDSPDPVGPDGNITYTVTVANAGPDAATNVTLSSFGSNNLRFVSASVPAGWNCTLPAAGTQTTSYTCTIASFASGANSVFTFVMQADDALIGNADTTIQFGFSANSSVSDPVPANNSETESTFYDVANANLGVTASDAPDPVNAGSNITYTGAVTNAGPDAATSVTLTIPLATSLLFQSISGPAGFACTTPAVGANGTITCTIASLANGANVPFTVVAQVNPSVASGPDGIVQQGFLIGASTNDPTGTNNTLTVNTAYLTPDANLAITNTDAPDPVVTNANVTYTITLTNNGPDAATNVTMTDTLSPGSTFQSVTPAAGFNCTTPAVNSTGTVTCTAASFANGATATFTIVAKATAASGSIGNTATASSNTFDPNTANNSATASTTIGAVLSADLNITNTTGTTNASPGSTIQYTIAIHNSGPDAAASVVMTDTLPAQLLFQSINAPAGFTCNTPAIGANGTISCSGATLANGATATFTLVTTVAPGASSGTLSNSASVSSATADPDSGDTTSTSSPIALAPAATTDLSITKTTPTTSTTTGGSVTYTITVTNNGPSTATNVVVTDALPAGLQYVSAVPSQGSCSGTTTVTCSLGTLNNGANATITLQTLVTSTGGSISNSASVSATEGDSLAGNNTATSRTTNVAEPSATAAVPTLSEWALIALAAMLGLAAMLRMKL